MSNNLEMLNRFRTAGRMFSENEKIDDELGQIARRMESAGVRIVVGDEWDAAKRYCEQMGIPFRMPKEVPRESTTQAERDAAKQEHREREVAEFVLGTPAVSTEHSAKAHIDEIAASCSALEMHAWAGYLRALADAKIAYQ